LSIALKGEIKSRFVDDPNVNTDRQLFKDWGLKGNDGKLVNNENVPT